MTPFETKVRLRTVTEEIVDLAIDSESPLAVSLTVQDDQIQRLSHFQRDDLYCFAAGELTFLRSLGNTTYVPSIESTSGFAWITFHDALEQYGAKRQTRGFAIDKEALAASICFLERHSNEKPGLVYGFADSLCILSRGVGSNVLITLHDQIKGVAYEPHHDKSRSQVDANLLRACLQGMQPLEIETLRGNVRIGFDSWFMTAMGEAGTLRFPTWRVRQALESLRGVG